MKRNPLSLILLLICAGLLSLNGVLHPCIHHHDTSYSDEGAVLHLPQTVQTVAADESFCPLCTGLLHALEWNGSGDVVSHGGPLQHTALPDRPPHTNRIELPPTRGPPQG